MIKRYSTVNSRVHCLALKVVLQVCGVLIEVEDETVYIGIGCNIIAAPDIPTEGVNSGRPSTGNSLYLSYFCYLFLLVCLCSLVWLYSDRGPFDLGL